MRLQRDAVPKESVSVWVRGKKIEPPKMKTILLTFSVHYITVPSCMYLCCWAAEFKNCVKKSDFKVRSGKYSTSPCTLSFLDKVCYLLCRSVSHQGQALPPICFKMPQVVYCKNTTVNAKWCVCPFSSNDIRYSKHHSFGNLKQTFCAC